MRMYINWTWSKVVTWGIGRPGLISAGAEGWTKSTSSSSTTRRLRLCSNSSWHGQWWRDGRNKIPKSEKGFLRFQTSSNFVIFRQNKTRLLKSVKKSLSRTIALILEQIHKCKQGSWNIVRYVWILNLKKSGLTQTQLVNAKGEEPF